MTGFPVAHSYSGCRDQEDWLRSQHGQIVPQDPISRDHQLLGPAACPHAVFLFSTNKIFLTALKKKKKKKILSQKNSSQKRTGRVAQGVGPEFKPQCCKISKK
jgi:hypothetical protein